jgi:hypothetical protein
MGLRPSFSAHVRWSNMGHPSSARWPVLFICSLNLPQASQLLLMNNRALDRPKALEGLRPAFSAHVSWCEHGAPVECAAAGTVHCSLNLPQASRLLGMTKGSVTLPWRVVVGRKAILITSARTERRIKAAKAKRGRQTRLQSLPVADLWSRSRSTYRKGRNTTSGGR